MKTKKFLATVLGVMTALTCVGCNKTPDGPVAGNDDVVIKFIVSDGGIGSEWLSKANERFMAKYKDKDYGNGKIGVFCDITKNQPSPANMSTDGYHVYFFDRSSKVSGLAAQGNSLDITEIVQEKYDDRDGEALSIEDKIPEEYRNFCKSLDGKYYAVPYTEVYGGLTYDKHLFDQKGLYFAKPDATATFPITSQKFGTSYNLIIPRDNANKSCGPDGEYGTSDDGLPSSIYELLALCDYMKTTLNISPFQLSGKYLNYINFFMDGMMTSLQGYDRAYSMYSLNGEIEVVTGYTNENLLGNISYLKKPTTKVINITEETGYYTTRTVEQYYAEALVEIFEKEGYFAKSNALTTTSHITAQEEFINSGYGENEMIAMLMEASYWNNESTIRDNFKMFYALNPEVTDREIAWMSLPVNIANTVTGEDGKKTTNGIEETVKGEPTTLIDTSRSAIVFNKKVQEDTALYEAVKDWIQFFNTDYELSKFTLESGLARPLNYQVTEEDREGLNYFRSSLWDLRANANVLRYEGNNETFKNNYAWFGRGFTENLFVCHEKNTMFQCLRAKKHGALESFEDSMVDKNGWVSMYKGSGTVGEIDGADYAR